MKRYVNRIAISVVLISIFLSIPVITEAKLINTPEVTIDSLTGEKLTYLPELVVGKRHEKYSKRNNPAVDLMRKLRSDRKLTDPIEHAPYSYNQYDKTVLAINDYNTKFTEGDHKLKRQLSFFENYVDTAPWTGKRLLDLSLKEKYSTVFYDSASSKKKMLVHALKSNGIDDAFNQDNIRAMLEDVLREIDIYDNDITLLQNRFVSPLSALGPDYYKYFITDTVYVGNTRCIELDFSPRTPESWGFNGKLFVPVEDTVKYVKRVSMRVPKDINVNYIKNVIISQNYTRDSVGSVHKVLDDICIELQVVPGTPQFFASRQSRYDSFLYEPRTDLSAYNNLEGEIFEADNANNRRGEYWSYIRPFPLTHAQKEMGSMMSRVRKVPLLYWTEKVIKVLVQGYITTGKESKFNFGPVNTFISYNTAEGMRLRVGGMTTARLTPHLFARGYVAYGCRDHKIKYNAELDYSFIKKKNHSREFPMNSIRGTYQYDIDQLGQHYNFTNADNVFLSLKRIPSDLITYRRLARLEYNLELKNYLSFNVGYRHETQEATRWISFIDGNDVIFNKFRQGCFFLNIRYAPGEKYVQSASNRLPVNMDAPVIQLTHEYGPRGLLGADFTLNKTELSVRKRFWFSAFGYLDAMVKGGKLWSQVQFPALLWQNANISYTIQPESYALLNPMEFAMDQFASVDMQYFINGAILNRIPVIKKAKLREIFTFKGFYGNLTKKNNPEYNPNLYRFPEYSHTREMGNKPYMEIGVGIDNILTILRVDYIWRLTYRDTPGIDKSGLRISLHFSF